MRFQAIVLCVLFLTIGVSAGGTALTPTTAADVDHFAENRAALHALYEAYGATEMTPEAAAWLDHAAAVNRDADMATELAALETDDNTVVHAGRIDVVCNSANGNGCHIDRLAFPVNDCITTQKIGMPGSIRSRVTNDGQASHSSTATGSEGHGVGYLSGVNCVRVDTGTKHLIVTYGVGVFL